MGCLVIDYWWNNEISVICGNCWDWTWTGPDFDNMERIKTYPTVTPLTLCPLIPLLRGRGAFVCVFTTPQRLPTQKKSKKGPHQKINLSKWSLLFFPALTFNQESETSTTVDGTTPEAQDTRSEDAIPQTPRFAIPWSKWIDLHDWRLHSHRGQVEWLRERLDDSNFWVKSGSVSLRNIETAAFVSFCLQSVQSQFSPGFHSMDQRGKISVQHVVFSLLKGHGGIGKKPSRNLLNCSHQVRDGVGDPASQILSINW